MSSARTLAAGLAVLAVFISASARADIERISKEDLRARLGDSDLVITDVRSVFEWRFSERKIEGAIRVEKSELSQLASRYGGDTLLVFYCD